MKNKPESDCVDSISSSDGSKSQSWGNVSDDFKSRRVRDSDPFLTSGLDSEMHQDPDRDRYIPDEEGTVFDHAADELGLTAVSKRPTSRTPHVTVVHTWSP